jgi:putative peptidoglycan lipid II flippase
MTLVSRVLGFLRDVVLAQAFGAGPATDAFFVAFKIPNFMRRLFAEGAFSLAFVPVFSEYRVQRGHNETRLFAGQVAGTLGGVLLAVTVVCELAAPLLVTLFAPGFIGDPQRFDLASEMLRITFPYLLLISLTAFAGGMLNSLGKFAVPALTPVLLNVVLIGAALYAAPFFETPIMALAWGVFAAGLAQLLFQIPALSRAGLLTRPRWGWRAPGVQRVLKLMVPTLFGSSVAQLNLLFDTLLASFLVAGSVSWLYYSDRLREFPLGLFGVALGTVILPSLSRHFADDESGAFHDTMDWALRWGLLVAVPASVGLAVLAGPMLATLFHHGAFSDQDVLMSQRSLVAYSLGLTGFVMIKVLAPGYYSRQDTRTPVRIGIIAMSSNMLMNLVLIWPLAHAGLALATSLSAFLNAGLLWRGLLREGAYRPSPGWGRFLLRLLLAAGIMGGALLWAAGGTQQWLDWDTSTRVWRLLLLISGGALVYALGLLAGGLRLRDLIRAS